MKRFLMLLAMAIACLSLFATTAEAKRFGGGGSIGKQRTLSQQQLQPPTAAPVQPGAQPAGNRWLGPLAGLALGAGLGALFASMGLGEGAGTLLMIILGVMAVMFLVSMFRRAQPRPAMGYAGGMPSGAQPMQQMPGGAAAANIPAGFPVEAFLRGAKTSFIRLQAANDRKDLDDIREYTTPEMFAEISMQIRERDNTPQRSDVLALNTDLLEVATQGDYAIASVRMRGHIRENNGAPEAFDEVWNVQKNLNDANAVWLLAGIQQVA
jgi:predicted lipid-binding transport protein (Tim44 family)